jgi:prepilin-type N-terminal cleavage/methylation domain-containing protein
MKMYARGFSLMELMVVIAIVLILLTIVAASISDARKDSRDKRRVTDLAAIELALTLYKEKFSSFPTYDGGVEIGEGGPLDGAIQQFTGSAVSDPLGQDAGAQYGYFYSSNFNCSGRIEHAIYALTMENERNANVTQLCGGNTGSASYVVILKQI